MIGDITAPLIKMLLKSTGELPPRICFLHLAFRDATPTSLFQRPAQHKQNIQPNIPQIDMKVRSCRVEVTVTGNFYWFYIGIVSTLTQKRNSFSYYFWKIFRERHRVSNWEKYNSFLSFRWKIQEQAFVAHSGNFFLQSK